MKTKLTIPFFCIALAALMMSFSSKNNASSINFQSSSKVNIVRTVVYYSFENVTNEMQIEKLKAAISLLKNVVEVKSSYKPEKKAGQIIVIIEEHQRISEGQEMFDITQIKKAIIKEGLSPLDVSITEEVVK